MRSVTFIHRPGEAGKWYDQTNNPEFNGNPPLMYTNDQAAWLACAIFDGARAFEGVIPDLDLHCQRAINSGQILRLHVPVDGPGLVKLAREACSKFPKDALLYIRLEIWATKGLVMADINSAAYAVSVMEAGWPKTPFKACFSTYRRPDPRSGPTLAKAIGGYATLHLALLEAKDKGCDMSVMMDLNDNVAEFTTANLCIVKNGIIRTPKPNGTFLNGITRQRVLGLLKEDGFKYEEITMTRKDVLEADEIFAAGNIGKVMPCGQVEDRVFEAPGPITKRAKELYWDFAHGRIKPKTEIMLTKVAA